MTELGALAMIVTLIFDWITSLRTSKVVSFDVALRLIILAPILFLHCIISEDVKIRLPYRRHPDFIDYYEA